MNTEYLYDKIPQLPYGIRTPYTSYLTALNKLGVLLIGGLILSMGIGLPTIISFQTRHQVLIQQAHKELEQRHGASASMPSTADVLQAVELLTTFSRQSLIAIFWIAVVLLMVLCVNLHYIRKLREYLLFAGEMEAKVVPSQQQESP